MSSKKTSKTKQTAPVKIEKTSFPGKRLLIYFSLPLIFLIIVLLSGFLYFSDKIYPGVKVAGVNLTALTYFEAETKLTKILSDRASQTLTFEYELSPVSKETGFEFLPKGNKEVTNSPQIEEYKISLKGQQFDLKKALDQAMEIGRKKAYFKAISIPLEISLNQSLKPQILEIAKNIDKYPIDSQLKVEDGQINVTPSQNGLILDQATLESYLKTYLIEGQLPNKSLPIKKAYPKLSYDEALVIKKRLDEIKLSPLKLQFSDLEFSLDLETLLSLIDLQNSRSTLVHADFFENPIKVEAVSLGGHDLTDSNLTLSEEKLNNYLKTLSSQINRKIEEPLFQFEGNRVIEFKPPQEGRSLNTQKASLAISKALITPGQIVVNLPVETIQPKNKLTNDLGIKELVGQGVSNFSGSIENRIFNIKLGASKINGVLIPPGEEFSFNKTVGDITAATGFKQAYVIKSGRTVLDDGGGICQVSTTLFRSVLNSGLPVTDRTAHAYRVTYYEQGFPPGLDATIFYPSVDFKFKNDTDHHILIQSYVIGTSLYIDLYGTKDGRIVNISTPVILNQTPPPPELRQDDPTLPKGTVKQVDWAAWGANVFFKRTVIRGGETIINETFKSNFRPWQAVFLVGTKEG